MTPHVPASAATDTSSSTDGTWPATAFEGSADALLVRLSRLRERVAFLVEHRSATDPTAAD